MSKDNQLSVSTSDDQVPTYDIPMRVKDMNFEDFDDLRDIVLNLIKDLPIAPSATISELVVALLQRSRESYEAWDEIWEQERKKKKEESENTSTPAPPTQDILGHI